MFETPGGYDYVAFCVEDLHQKIQVCIYIHNNLRENVDPIR